MAQTSAFYRAQEAAQHKRAAGSTLDNVRMIATTAAAAWRREAVLAERREAAQAGRKDPKDGEAAPLAAAPADMDEPSENPDSGFSDDADDED